MNLVVVGNLHCHTNVGVQGATSDILFVKILWCYCESNATHNFKNVSFVKGVPDFENPENIPTLKVLVELMDSAYSTKVIQVSPKDRIIVILFCY